MPLNSTSPHSGGHNGTDGRRNATAIAAQIAARQKANMWNQNSVKLFAAAMAGVIILFTVFHWSRFLYGRYASRGVRKSGPMRAQVSVARYVELSLGVFRRRTYTDKLL
jgi:ribosomal protein S11